MKYIFRESFKKDLKKYKSNKRVQKLVERVVDSVEKAKTTRDISGFEPLSKKPFYKIKKPPYRFGIDYKNGLIEFVRFGDRKDFYDSFPP